MSNNYVILHPENDSLAIVVPAPGISVDQVLLAVPSGTPYLIIDRAELPSDHTFREAWEADFSNAPLKE